jgi:flagellar biosynthesis regulator FlaF
MPATIEGDRKMKNRAIFPSVILLLFFSISIASTALAEYAFNDPEVPQESKKAASLVFQTLSMWFESLKYLEQDNVPEANKIKTKMVDSLRDALREYEKVRKQTSTKPVYELEIPTQIRRDFAKFEVPFPADKKGIADLTIRQIQLLKKSIESMDYSRNAPQNREQIRIMIGKLWQIVVLGLDSSEIAASVK